MNGESAQSIDILFQNTRFSLIRSLGDGGIIYLTSIKKLKFHIVDTFIEKTAI